MMIAVFIITPVRGMEVVQSSATFGARKYLQLLEQQELEMEVNARIQDEQQT